MPNYDSTVKAVLHSSYLPKMPLEKSQVKFKSRSEVMPVFKLYLWHHPWETFGTMANFLYNSSFSRNTRYPYIGAGFQLIITKIGANEEYLFQNTKTTKFHEITFSVLTPVVVSLTKKWLAKVSKLVSHVLMVMRTLDKVFVYETVFL